MKTKEYSLNNQNNQTENDRIFKHGIGDYFDSTNGNTLAKLENFPRHVPRQNLALFLAKNEIFKKVINIHGSVVECGVFMGGGLFSWAQLSAIYEPYNHNRKIVGFDSFEGFPSIGINDDSDALGSDIDHKTTGGYSFPFKKEIEKGVELFDLNRPIGHLEKVSLISGDACETIPEFVATNPHFIASLLYLDFDLFEPTVTALREFMPRMPCGAVIGFDELNQAQWPGETLAVLEEVGLQSLRLERFAFTPHISYAVIM